MFERDFCISPLGNFLSQVNLFDFVSLAHLLPWQRWDLRSTDVFQAHITQELSAILEVI